MQLGVGHINITKSDKKLVNDVLNKGRLSYGEYHRRFEAEFAKLHDVKYASFVNSGTSALQIALHALKIKYRYSEGAEVIVPAVTFVASVNTILQNGLKPVFVDVEHTYYDIDPEKIEDAITDRTVAIMSVHIGGLPCDMEKIMAIAKEYGLQVIEDSCETMFVSQKGKKVGSFGDVSCFSTYVAHLLTTGVGGFACTSDPELAVLMKSLANHGRDSIYLSIDDDKGKKDLFKVVDKRFSFEHIGYSYRATELEAALGLGQLQRHKKDLLKRQKNAQRLTKGLSSLTKYLILPSERPNTQHAFMFYAIVLQPEVDRDRLVAYLEQHDIETRYLLPLLNQPVYKKMWGEIEYYYPQAYYLNRKAFYVGCHPGLTNKDIDYIISTFKEYFNEL